MCVTWSDLEFYGRVPLVTWYQVYDTHSVRKFNDLYIYGMQKQSIITFRDKVDTRYLVHGSFLLRTLVFSCFRRFGAGRLHKQQQFTCAGRSRIAAQITQISGMCVICMLQSFLVTDLQGLSCLHMFLHL